MRPSRDEAHVYICEYHTGPGGIRGAISRGLFAWQIERWKNEKRRWYGALISSIFVEILWYRLHLNISNQIDETVYIWISSIKYISSDFRPYKMHVCVHRWMKCQNLKRLIPSLISIIIVCSHAWSLYMMTWVPEFQIVQLYDYTEENLAIYQTALSKFENCTPAWWRCVWYKSVGTAWSNTGGI